MNATVSTASSNASETIPKSLPPVCNKTCCALGRCIVTTGLQACAACQSVMYCGKEHQTEHFKEGHKLVCPGRSKGVVLCMTH